MTLVGDRSQQVLRARGEGAGLELLLSGRSATAVPDDHPVAQLFEHERMSGEWSHFHWRMLQFFDAALSELARDQAALQPWLGDRLLRAWSRDEANARGALTELEALGTLREAFSFAIPLKESRTATPDLVVPGRFCIEAYCPRVSTQDRQSVTAQVAKQTSFVKIAVSHPHAGSAGLSLRFPANKIVDRFLNTKRESSQFDPTKPNILYVDARREWKLCAADALPFRTKHSLGHHWIGTLGVWHAFYGEKGRRTMLQDRASMRFLQASQIHSQTTQGLFRANRAWSAGLIALTDGIVLFENPWASAPLDLADTLQCLRLPMMRAEFSWQRHTSQGEELLHAIEETVDRMELMFEKLAADSDTSHA